MRSFKNLGFLSVFMLPLLLFYGHQLGGSWNLLLPIFVFVAIPILDVVVGTNHDNLPQEDDPNPFYRIALLSWVPLQLYLFVWVAPIVAQASLSEIILMAFNIGLLTGGIGITIAHELGHKSRRVDKISSQILLMTVCYMHFYIEHNRGHHVAVATPEDPATARKGETFYAFWVRSVVKGYGHAWKLESESWSRKGINPINVRNAMIWYALLPVAFCLLVMVIAFNPDDHINWWVYPFFFVLQSVIGFTLLELVNYVEHYGIVRKLDGSGRYERVNPLHSWNTSHLISNFFLFHLQRHSDHHTVASKPYQYLLHIDESPQLPSGYPGMILLALIPPLWFRFMDSRLESWKKSLVSS